MEARWGSKENENPNENVVSITIAICIFKFKYHPISRLYAKIGRSSI